MKQRLLSIALALCLCMSFIPPAQAEDSTVPTPQQVYATLIAFKEADGYKEGTLWDNDTHKDYEWNGGPVAGGITVGDGCAYFAFYLSDAAFGSLSARTLTTGNFTLSDVRAGDILRILGNSHSVIVLQVTASGVVIAEANYHVNNGPGMVHWERTLSKEEVEAANYLITRYPEGYVAPDDPTANEVIGQGTLDGGLTWKLTRAGTLTISGSGAMPDFETLDGAPWYASRSSILDIVLESGVTSVGNYAFYESSAIGVTIPSSVTKIGNGAFRGASLVGVTIPSSVETIGDSAFRECANLASVNISGVKTIEQNAFRACTKLSSITLPASVTSVGDAAFFECTEMTEAAFIPGTAVVTMGPSMFARCYKLSKVTLPQKVNCISDSMFMNCSFLTSVTIPEGAESIEGSAFASCGALTQVYIPSSVTSIGSAAFSACTYLKDIYFGGTEAQWNSISKLGDTASAVSNMTIHYNAEPETPSVPSGHTHSWDTAWAGDSAYHWHECIGEGTCDITENSDKDGYGAHVYDSDTDDTCNTCGYVRTLTPTPPAGHTHSWTTAWTSDNAYHWHECTAEDCDAAENSDKDGYGAHSYGGWVVDMAPTAYQNGIMHRTCTVCGYSQTESIPATGAPSDIGTPPSTTTGNQGSSNTTAGTDKPTGTVTETTRNPDGSQTVVETSADGTVTTLVTDQTGNKTETVAKPDGSSTTVVERNDGTTATIVVDTTGRVAAEVRLSAPAVSAALQSGSTVALPIPEVHAARNTASAPAVTVTTGSAEPVRVEIPTASPTPGTVAVIVNADGTEEVVKTSVPTAGGVAVSLSNGATVKIVDNSRSFMDISSQYWAADAIDFVSARELFAGTTEDSFTPEAPMTRAMLMVVLARLDGADTDGGATWYEKGVAWAVANGISDGSSSDESISREQLVTMLWRYAGSPSAAGALSSFTDAGQISGYAQEAMGWAVENGIVSGFGDGTLGPQGQATRAQVAQMLENFIEM